jgi:hypothetical protein
LSMRFQSKLPFAQRYSQRYHVHTLSETMIGPNTGSICSLIGSSSPEVKKIRKDINISAISAICRVPLCNLYQKAAKSIVSLLSVS